MKTRRHFTVSSGGDPYSRAADVREETATGTIYCGDLSGRAGKRATESLLRRLYPGCRVSREP